MRGALGSAAGPVRVGARHLVREPTARIEPRANPGRRWPALSSPRSFSSATGSARAARVPVRETQLIVDEYLAMVRRRPVAISLDEDRLATPASSEELITAQSSSAVPLPNADLRQAFDALDVDRSGALEHAEIRQLLMRTLNQENQYSDEQLHAAMAELDQDQDGRISYEEFAACWRALEKRSSTAALSPLEQALASGVLSSVSEYQDSLHARR